MTQKNIWNISVKELMTKMKRRLIIRNTAMKLKNS